MNDHRPQGPTVAAEVDQLRAWLTESGALKPGEVITGAVVLFETEVIDSEGQVEYRRGRSYPLGRVSPSVERGLIERAVDDLRSA